MNVSTSDSNMTKGARRQAILEAALKSFSAKGFNETTMEDIRHLSGASTGSIYHHFENKEMLALTLYIEGRNDWSNALFASIAGKHPQEGIKDLVRAYLGWFEQHPDLGQYVIQAGSTEYLGAYIKVLRQKTLTAVPAETFPQQFYDWLAPFINDGTIIRLPQQVYIPLVIGPSREFVRRWLKKRLLSELEEAREPLAEAAWVVLSSSPRNLQYFPE
jgi:AcrR family transcriptional regulator